MAMRSSDSALANRLISQYGTSKHLCDRLVYAWPTLGVNALLPLDVNVAG
jgi:hypothetical protein